MGLIIEAAARARRAQAAKQLLSRPAALASVKSWLFRVLSWALTSLLFHGAAQAQLIDDLDFRREGANAVLQIRFVTEVQYLRSVVARAGDQSLVFYRVLPTAQTMDLQTSERHLNARRGALPDAGLPAVTVTDELASGGVADERRLVVRLGSPVKHRVRAGRGNRSIELVLEGLGPQVPPAAAVSALAPAAAPSATPLPADVDLDRRAADMLARAQQSLGRDDFQAAIDTLSQLLDLPPTASTRTAQALIGQARQRAGDTGRARAEYEVFLRLYPTGDDADRIRAALAALSPQDAPGPTGGRRAAVITTLTASLSSFYYGGQSRVRTQEFQDSPLSGLPQLVSDATLSDTDQSQLVSQADVNWRHRDAESDRRFVFRDTHYKDFNRPDKTRNKLSSLYYDHRSFALGTSVRAGRQTPLGGGVLGRFDGVQAGYTFRPRWKASVVAGVPTDTLLDARRYFYGTAVEAEALTPQLGGSLYFIEQKIDGEVDRRAVGSDMRYFDGGLSGSAQLDYDLALKGMNVVSLQATWQRPDNTVLNFLYDRRSTPMMMLGNMLFFGGAGMQPPPTRVSDLLSAGASIDTLREQVRSTTAKSTQAALSLTTPIHPKWQLGADVRYSSTGAIAPVADLLPQGQPATGDIWSLGLQLIGANLYSARDTHVFIANFVRGPAFQGQLLSYNNSSQLATAWQVEPSFKYYRQTSTGSVQSTRWSPGLRVTWRVRQEFALESELNVESSKTSSPTRNEAATRTFYYLGGRYDF